VLLTVGLFGCGHDEELTSKNPYADLIGSEYRVIVEDLYAYGIYQSPEDKSTIGRITLIPGVGIGGRDVAFRRHVPKGHIIRIISAWRQPLLFDNGVYYLVAVEGVDFPSGVPVNLELFRGNEGVDADLNPNVYVKLSSKR
jgi:hypothetical protein